MTRNWIAVASADHVRLGQAQGFMQVCHGKGGPLKRLQANDKVVYYSPTISFGSKQAYQCFTAFGLVLPRPTYQATMSETFHPFRRDVAWLASSDASIRPLLQQLEFSRGKVNWAYPFRFGLFEISSSDMELIAQAMLVPNTQALPNALENHGQASLVFE